LFEGSRRAPLELPMREETFSLFEGAVAFLELGRGTFPSGKGAKLEGFSRVLV
jgi:hypothetical protein